MCGSVPSRSLCGLNQRKTSIVVIILRILVVVLLLLLIMILLLLLLLLIIMIHNPEDVRVGSLHEPAQALRIKALHLFRFSRVIIFFIYIIIIIINTYIYIYIYMMLRLFSWAYNITCCLYWTSTFLWLEQANGLLATLGFFPVSFLCDCRPRGRSGDLELLSFFLFFDSEESFWFTSLLALPSFVDIALSSTLISSVCLVCRGVL